MTLLAQCDLKGADAYCPNCGSKLVGYRVEYGWSVWGLSWEEGWMCPKCNRYRVTPKYEATSTVRP